MPPCILIVEDNPDNLKLITWVLEDEGYCVKSALSAEEALEFIEYQDFQLILMDIDLPVMNGKEATKLMRQKERLADLPIIAVTAHALQDKVREIMSSGFTDIAVKPINESTLVEMIKRSLKQPKCLS